MLFTKIIALKTSVKSVTVAFIVKYICKIKWNIIITTVKPNLRYQIKLLLKLKFVKNTDTYLTSYPSEPKFRLPNASGLRVECHLKGSLNTVSASRGF